MKDKPIIFSAPMVQALLAGRKTQTRRTVKPQPEMVTDKTVTLWEGDPATLLRLLEQNKRGCPYGHPGDLLWVREAWAMHPYSLPTDPEPVTVYRATDAGPPAHDRWKPSIHMPRWASRLTLHITDVRVERLQEISEVDAEAEGAEFHDGRGIGHSGWRHDFSDVHGSPRSSFSRLWDSINGPGAWDANPWVWALTFEVIRANVDAVLQESAA